MAEEFEIYSPGTLGAQLDPAADLFFQAEKDNNACSTEATRNALDVAKKRVEEQLFKIFHKNPRTALCFSGGGVRSATFGLGFLHGLAKISPSPLPKFDFLSTVSGGGYVGGWFSAWAARNGGTAAVATELSKTPTSTLDPEPKPLLHIRRYSNFLNPKLGALSADTWTLVSTITRNMILNWLILIPLLMAILILPQLYRDLIARGPGDVGNPLTLYLGAATAIMASAYFGLNLPSFTKKNPAERAFVLLALLPLIVSGLALSLHWAWQAQCTNPPYGRLQLFLFGAAVNFLGAFCATLLSWKGRTARTVSLLVGSAASGGCAGFITYLLSLAPWANHPGWYTCLAPPIVLLSFTLAIVCVVGVLSEVTNDEDREWWARAGGWMLLSAAAWAVFGFSVLGVPPLLSSIAARATAIGGTGLLGMVASRLGFSAKTGAGRDGTGKSSSWTKDLLAKLAGPAFLLFLIGVLSLLNTYLLGLLPFQEPSLKDIVLAFLLLLLAGTSSLFVNVNRFTLHAMYRMRLVRTYLGASTLQRDSVVNRFIDMTELDNIPMADLHANRPLHIVNMALNLVGGKNLAWQQRKAESFTSSRLRTGSLRVGYQQTAVYGGTARGLTLGSAVAISGAAASPNMGYHSSPLVTFVMTLFNARLGWWLANPGLSGKGAWSKDGPTLSVVPIISEALGMTNDDSTWVYLSDGGHFENLGLYEMVLRRCHRIVIVDGSQDSAYNYEDLGNAIRKIRVDLGIPIEFKDGLPIFGACDNRNRYCALGTICYDCVDGPGAPSGEILYVKACLNGTEPPDVANYAASYASFPQQGTEELWFDEAQFESYRRLGSHIAETLGASFAAGAPIDQLFKGAQTLVKSQNSVKYTRWPRQPELRGNAAGTIGSANVSLTMKVVQE